MNDGVIVVFGASGDLSYKKTFPALYGLFAKNLLPSNIHIIGYARSKMELSDFKSRVSSRIKGDESTIAKFLERCWYVSGQYDQADSFIRLSQFITSITKAKRRIFYMALPPSVFAITAQMIKEHLYTEDSHLIVEKPFGRDTQSSLELGQQLQKYWKEEQVYRIDHYLGKEMVKNLMVLRFGNVLFGAVWNRHYISNVQITFKEPFGTQGRGGYFDDFGILRDVMQNHLLQILTIVAMEQPVTLDAEDVRNEKVKVLKKIKPLQLQDVLLGQYVGNGKEPGYLEDSTVPSGSNTPTFAAAVFHIKNERWDGVPFILKCGKALNEQKTEVRIQFHNVPGPLFKGLERNELVIRVQPQEAVYMKFMNKTPGLTMDPVISELDLSYSKRYSDIHIPDAYESLLLDVLNSDRSNFVRDDELLAAWKIFTPVLHRIENDKIQPEYYTYGSRGPASLDDFVAKQGYARQANYVWSPSKI